LHFFKIISEFVLIVSFSLGCCFTSWAQDVKLQLEVEDDSLKTKKTFRFDTFSEAETYLDHKIDSLKQINYPFLESNMRSEDQTLQAHLFLNKKIDSIHIYVEKKDARWLPKKLKPKTQTLSIPYSEVNTILTSVVAKLQASGAAFGKANLEDIQLTGKTKLKARLKVKPGQNRTIDAITIKGYSKLSNTYIKRYSNLKRGDQFIESELKNKTEQLNNVAFLKVKKPTDVLFTKDSTEIFIYLEKQQSNSFDGFLGFGNTENEGFQLNGYLNMVLLNNLNKGERFNIIYKNDGSGQQIFEADARLPFILKTPMSLEAHLRLFRQDSAFSNNSQRLDVSYQLNDKMQLKAGVESITSSSLEGSELATNADIVDYNSMFYSLSFEFLKLTTQEYFNEPSMIRLKASAGERQGEANADQYKIQLNAQHQIDINFRNKIFLNLHSEALVSDTYLNNELFRFGGINTIRGFSENALIGNFYTLLQTEYRYLLDTNLYAGTVLDLGNYENQQYNFNETILGFGIGLGLRSKSGILKLTLANSIADSQKSSFSNTKVHIGFTSFF